MPETARKGNHWWSTGGPWGAGLAVLGIAVAMQGARYIAVTRDEQLPGALAWLGQAVPIQGWGLLWIGAGLWSVWKGLTPPQRHSDLIPAVAVISFWAAIYALHWLITGCQSGHWTADWATAIAWASLATTVGLFGRCVNPTRGPRGL